MVRRMSDEQPRLDIELLDELERLESRLLSWGVVDGGFTYEELLDAPSDDLQDAIEGAGEVVDDLIEQLDRQRLLLRLRGDGEDRFRTRMAETIRLLVRLRQLFSKHERGNSWQTASTLVADYRFLNRPREYPKRNLDPDTVLAHLKGFIPVSSLEQEAILAIIAPDGREPFQLSRFQDQATSRLLSELHHGRDSGTIVCAGTGSGKTLAFYLPALAHVCARIDGEDWTKAIAVYPRNELLIDQFTEAYGEARKLDGVLSERGLRKVRLGAFFGPTPRNIGYLRKYDKWRSEGGRLVCPFLRCPRCESPMVWPRSALEAGKEALRCINRCGVEIGEDEIVLTRDRMERCPPDILFTSTESLNRQMTDSRTGPIFGVGDGVRRKPELVLLDEVHTYEGASGAHVALLMRRWRRMVDSRVHFVGLSATLLEAREFFARLVGLDPIRVSEVVPQTDDMVRGGMEYMLALRGDPVSQTSLLSTTIQTVMLLRRMLEPTRHGRAGKIYGSRLFAFCDNLDVLNRLFFDLQDAEGRDSWGRPHSERDCGSLATLRNPSRFPSNQRHDRALAGQSWDACMRIGHPLHDADRLVVGRTSSQDAGVDAQADAVIATASLDVGFNDPRVGAMVQHKAPRGAAQFLQRKGRAGRPREMRPWTVVVLSDYGRDRMAYQSYDLLFSPVLEPRILPVRNRHILKMQSVYSFMEWISPQLERVAPGSVWLDFAGPPDRYQGRNGASAARRQRAAAKIIRSVLENLSVRRDLKAYLASALQVNKLEVEMLLWEPPRALLTAVLPTLLRRLESGWARVLGPGTLGDDYMVGWMPLPEFVPASLFSDLNLPEVEVVTPAQQQGQDEGSFPMPVARALGEFAPGRVSKRFGVAHRFVRHWIAPANLDDTCTVLSLGSFCDQFDDLGDVEFESEGQERTLRCIRPYRYHTTVPEKRILETSNAMLQWHVQLGPLGTGIPVDVPRGSPWEGLVRDLTFFTHGQRAPVRVRRFATSSACDIGLRGGERLELEVSFADDDGEPIAMGFFLEADGLLLRFRMPELDEGIGDPSDVTGQGLRADYFRDLVLSDDFLAEHGNVFVLGWLVQVYRTALVELASRIGGDLREAVDTLHEGDIAGAIRAVMDLIFQSLPIEAEGGEPSVERQSLWATIEELFLTTGVVDRLRSLVQALWDPDAEDYRAYLRRRLRATLGAALSEACVSLCPEFNDTDLVVDLHPGPRPADSRDRTSDEEEIWLTETSPGGGGVVEELARRITEDPRRFFQVLKAALSPTSFDHVDRELRHVLCLTQHDLDVQRVFHAYRTASSQGAIERAFADMRYVLTSKQVELTHPVTAALQARVLRPQSSADSDRLLASIVDRWTELETRLGFEIDIRAIAYVISADSAYALPVAVRPGIDDPGQWRFNTILGLLWPRGSAVRAQTLRAGSMFAEAVDSHAELLLRCLGREPDRVSILDDDFEAKARDMLRSRGAVTLESPRANGEQLREAMLEMLVEPIDVNYLVLHPRISGMRQDDQMMSVTLDFRESGS